MGILISVVEDLNHIDSKKALKKWEEHFDKKASECSFLKCDKKTQGKLTGKFVKKAFSSDGICIIPICTKHKDEIHKIPYVKDNTAFFNINE